jgi:hypothetical protein
VGVPKQIHECEECRTCTTFATSRCGACGGIHIRRRGSKLRERLKGHAIAISVGLFVAVIGEVLHRLP